MVISRIPSSFDVPIFDGSNDVAWIGGSKHDLNFVPYLVFDVGKQHIEPAACKLNSLAIDNCQLAQTKDRRVVTNPVMKPYLAELGVTSQRNRFMLDVLKRHVN